MSDDVIVYTLFEQALDEIAAGEYAQDAQELAAHYNGMRKEFLTTLTLGFIAGLTKGLELADAMKTASEGKGVTV